MDTTYIQFEEPESGIRTKDKSSFKRSFKNFAVNLLTNIFPRANPDFEHKIDTVKYWLVECDSSSGVPEREIGLDEQGRVILKMPFEENGGYWTDNNLLLDDFKKYFKVSEISKEAFELQWTLFDKLSNFEIELENFSVLSTGADGGHKYITTEIVHNDIKRRLTLFFANKTDEAKITASNRITVSGRLIDEGLHQSLLLLDAELIGN